MDKNKAKKLKIILLISVVITTVVGLLFLFQKRDQSVKTSLAVISEKRDFKVNEDTEFEFKYLKAEVASAESIKEDKADYWEDINVDTEIKDPQGLLADIDAEISFEDNGQFSVKFKKPQSLKPGVYTMKLKVEDESAGLKKVKEIEHEFRWGVLAINTNKSIYLSGEQVYLQMGAVRDDGHTICDANLELRIKNNELGINEVLSTEDGTIEYSGQCHANNVVDVPDYSTYYQVEGIGKYEMRLINLDNGYEITDYFEVQQTVPFDVERISATRIWPWSPYEMIINIKANQDFEGKIIEIVPRGFEIISQEAEIKESGEYIIQYAENGDKEIVWQDINLVQGDELEIRYSFDAPDKYPYLYLLGSLTIRELNNEIVFQEARSWQIASDALNEVFLFWDKNSDAPSGWACISCSPADPYYEYFLRGNGTPGGSASTTHQHTTLTLQQDSGPLDGGSLYKTTGSGNDIPATDHVHPSVNSPLMSDELSIPPYYELKVIYKENPLTIPAEAIAIFDSSLPTGWTDYTAADGYIIRAGPNASDTSDTFHSHSNVAFTVAASESTPETVGSKATQGEQAAHTHSVTGGTSDASTQLPPHIGVFLAKATSDRPLSQCDGMIAMFNTTPLPSNWTAVSAINDSNYFIQATTSVYGNTGGSTTHTHPNKAFGSGATGDTQASLDVKVSGAGAPVGHTHNITVSFDASADDNIPPYIYTTFAKYSAPKITVAGTVYSNEGVSTLDCDGACTVKLMANGADACGGPCEGTTSGGAYSIADVMVGSENDVLTVFLNGESQKAVTITKASSTLGYLLDLDLYQNRVIIRDEGDPAASTTIADMAQYDNSGDSDIQFTATTTNGNSTTTTIFAGNKLYIWPGKEFIPGGSVIVQGGDTGSDVDGDFHIAVGSTYTATAGTSTSIGGSWIASSSATFTHNNVTTTFTATTTGKKIWLSNGNDFYNLEFDGSGGAWQFNLNSATATNNFFIKQGTVTSPSEMLYVGGSWYNAGTFTPNTATTTFDSTDAGETIDPGDSSFYNVEFDHGSGGWTFTSDATTTNNFFITQGAVTAYTGYLDVGDSFKNAGTFTNGSGIVRFYATDSGNTITPGGADFYDLYFDGSSGSWTFTSNSATATNDFYIYQGTITSPSEMLYVGGSWLVGTSGTFTHNNSTTTFNSSDAETIDPDESPFYNIDFNNGTGDWTFDSDATTTNNFTITQGTITAPSFLAVGNNFLNAGTFEDNLGIVRFYATDENNTITTGGAPNPFYNVRFDGSGGGWIFASGDHDVDGYFWIIQGTVTSTEDTLYVGNMWQNDSGGTFNATTGTVYFNSTGGSILAGDSSFYNVIFNSASGDWNIIQSATSTNNWTITDVNSLSVEVFDKIEVQGEYIIGDSVSSATVWGSNSILYLNSGTSYTVGSKTQDFEEYGILEIGVNTDIRMWKSHATTTTVDPSGSLYSMDYDDNDDGVSDDGYLYIFGDYHIPAGGTDYWSYQTDFDGTDLTGSERQAHVRFAANSTTTFDAGETLHATGTDANTSTTIDVQESGTYAIKVNGGTLNMYYYQIRNINENGLWMTGSPTIESLDYGDYLLEAGGSTLIKVASAVIDANSSKEITGCEFSSSTGAAAVQGYNVTATGVTTNYWLFASHTGNYDGEDYDLDPGGDPGYLKWDDSLKMITIFGTVYQNEGVTTMGSGRTVRVKVNGGGNFSTTTDAAGDYWIESVEFFAINDVFTVFLDEASEKAVTVTKASSTLANIVDLDLYENRVIVKHEDAPADPITIADMAQYDFSGDPDIRFTATTTNGTATTTTIFSGNKLYIWPEKTFNASGTVTILGNAGGEPDGSLHIADGSTLIACPAADCTAGNEITLAGSWIASSSATFIHNNVTTTFTATTTGKNIWTEGSSDFYNIVFNGSGGGWEFRTNSATATNNFWITQGTATSASEMLYVGGSWYNADIFNATTGTVYFNSSGGEINPGNSPFYKATFNSASGDWTITNDATSTNTWTITATNSFTVNPSVRIQVGGIYDISISTPSATTWGLNSVLRLDGPSSNTVYTIGSKIQDVEQYDTLEMGSTYRIRMWNSHATTTIVETGGSLYSQDYDVEGDGVANDGYLYIWGDYHIRVNQTEYWTYETDFDGTDLGGSDRQVHVRMAANSTTTFNAGETLHATGIASASTTIDRQDSGNYALKVDGGTLNMEYYEIRNINENGLWLTGSPTVTSLSYGDYELALEGGTLITVDASVISNNAELTIAGCEFSTTSDLTTAYNVTESGTPTSYWTFAGSYGNFDGEDYDSDPGDSGGENAGYIRWSDSPGLTLTQYYYRWYDNISTSTPVTPLAATNTQATNATSGTVFRLRVNVKVTGIELEAQNASFTIQYASATDCAAVSEPDWTEIGSFTADYSWVWRGYNNNTGTPPPEDGSTLENILLVGKSDVLESYEESSPSVNNPNEIPAGQAGEWDWVLQYNAAYSSRTYCFRMADDEGNALDGYYNDIYPKIVTYAAATWKESEDTEGSAATGTDIRLRFQIVNTGDATAIDYNYQIEYASRTDDTCGDETFIPMPILNTSSTALFEMTTSSFFRYQDPTTHQLSATGTYPFNTGQLVETYATTGDMDVGDVSLSEVEYVFHISTTTPEDYYCFRTTNEGVALDNYNVYGVLYVGALGVDLSGTIYSSEGGTPYGCDGTELTVIAKVNGAGSYEGTCTQSNGNYTIPTLTVSAGDVITVFLNGETEKAVAVTKAIDGNTSISGLDLYEDRVILRSDNGVALTIENMAQYDNSDDTDIQFTATTTNGTATTTTIFSGNKLYIWTNDSFSPGGEVKVLANADSEPSGSLHIGTGATFTAGATTTVGGSWIASSTATFTHNNYNVVFTASSTDKEIRPVGSSNFYNIIFDGSGGEWTFTADATTTNNFTITAGTVTSTDGTLAVGNNFENSGAFNATTGIVRFYATDSGNQITTNGSSFYDLLFEGIGGEWTPQDAVTLANDLTMATGTLLGTQNITVNGGDVTGDGTINLTGGTFLVDGEGDFGGSTDWTFYNLTFGDGVDSDTTTAISTATTTISNLLTIASNQGLEAGSSIWEIAGYSISSTPFLINGNFDAQTSTFRYTTDQNTNITATTYYNLELIDPPDDTGWTNGGTFSWETRPGSNNNGHVNPQRAELQDDSRTAEEIALGAGNYGDWHRSTNFNFSIPDGATIDGIEVRFDRYGQVATHVEDSSLRLRKSSGQVGDDKQTDVRYAGSDTDTYVVYGGLADDWNADLSVSDINSSGFGVDLSVENTTIWTRDWYIDHIQIKIYYAPAAEGTIYTLATTTGKTLTINNDLTIGNASDTMSVTGATHNPTIDVNGNVTITASSTFIAPISSPFTVAGSWSNSGTFNHSNATVTFDGTSIGETITATTSDFYNVEFDSGSGGWEFTANATTANDFIITAGTVTSTDGTLAVGNNFDSSGGTFYANSGTVKFFATDSGNQITTNESDFYQLLFDGSGGSWTLQDHTTSTATTTVDTGTLIQGTDIDLTLGGLYIETATGAFTKDAGTGVLYFERTADGDPSVIDDVQADNNLGDVYIGYSPGVTNQNSDIIVDSFTVNEGDTHNTRGYEIDSATFVNILGTLNATDGKENDGTIIYLQTDWTNTGTFTAGDSTTTFDGATEDNSINPGDSDFNNVVINGTGGWEFESNSATATNNFWITQGTATSASEMFYVGGSWKTGASGSFIHNSATTTFNSSDSETINPGESPFYNLDFDNGTGVWTFDSDATTTNNFTITQGLIKFPDAGGYLNVGNNFLNSDNFFAMSGYVKFFATDAGNTINPGDSDFAMLEFNGSGGEWEFETNSATTSSHFYVYQGTVTSPSEMLYVGGSWTVQDAGTFLHNNATTTFNTAGGALILPGSSPFYNVDFDGTGSFMLAGDATSTNNWFITDTSSFNFFPVRLEVGGQYSISDTVPSTTNWQSNSLLYLNSGTAYTIGSKSQETENYDTLQIGVNTDIRMWNSNATTTTVDPSGSLYSMDHDMDADEAADDGYLYIWGDYHIPAGGTDYWTYESDFDGTPAANRQVNVRFAANSTTTFDTGETLHATGTASASTTIDRQSSGNYALKVDGGILNMEYYEIRNANENGLWLTGSPTVTSLDYGDYGLSVEGGTMMTVASAVIDANNTLEITGCEFSTTSDLTTAYNVTEVGTPSSYWTFTVHYGNLDGEDYDNDPGDIPGYIRWDDSGITVSGIIYTNEGVTAFNCVGDNLTVKIELNGAGDYTDVCNAGDGSYSMTVPVSAVNDVLTAFIDGHGSFRAVTITKASSSDDAISGLDIYQNRVIVRHEDEPADPITIADMAYYDANDDTDIKFTATTTNGTATTTTIFSGNKLYIWPGKTFNASGSIAILGNAGGEPDGSLHIADGATLTACPAADCSAGNEITLAGSWIASSSATFTHNNVTTTFTATTTGKNIWTNAQSFYNLKFNGVNGGWQIMEPASTTNDLSMAIGTLSGTQDFSVYGGDAVGYGTINLTGGTFTLDGEGYFGSSGDSGWIFYNLTFGDGSGITTTTDQDIGTGASTTVTNILTVAENQGLDARNDSWWALLGSGTPFVINGRVNASSSYFYYKGTSATIVATTTYYYLFLTPSGGSPTYTIQNGELTVSGLVIGDNENAVTVTAATNDPDITVGGVAIYSGGTLIASETGTFKVTNVWYSFFDGVFTHSNATVTFDAIMTSAINPGCSPFYNVEIVSGDWWLNYNDDVYTCPDNTTTTNDFTITGGSVTSTDGSLLAVGNNFDSSGGTFYAATGTVKFFATDSGNTITTGGTSNPFYDLLFDGSGGGWTFASGDHDVNNDFTILQGTATSTASTLRIGGDWRNEGTFIHNSGTVLFDANDTGHTIDDGGSPFYLLTFNGSGGTWLYQDGASVSPATTTVQNGTSTFLNAKTGSVDVTGGELLVDWYLGTHLVDASSTATNIDTDDCDDITITEGSASSTIWGYIEGTGWDGPYNSTTTGTGVACGGASGINPQPGSTTAIRIREYKKTATETSYYKYNLKVDWQTNYGEYDYYDDYGNNYLTSASSTQSSGVDKVITETWYRSASSTINSPYTCSAGSGNQCINQPSDNGSWYVGMRVGLMFEIVSGLNVDFGELNSTNEWTAEASSTLEVSTSASNGYVITAWAINEARMRLSSFDIYIPKYDAKNDVPEEWDETCSPQNPDCCGFGFSTDDSDLSGGTANRFTSGGGTTCGGVGASGTRAYSGFATSTETVALNPVGDLSNSTTTDRTIITYKVSVGSAQAAGNYQTTVIYIATANY